VIAGAQSCFPLLAAEPLPVRRSLGEGGSAARERAAHAPTWTTSPLKTRVGVSRRRASGRLSRRRRSRSMFTPGSRACGYSTASGRAKWLNRDPIGEVGGKNLYGCVVNDAINGSDPVGLCVGSCGTALAVALPGLNNPLPDIHNTACNLLEEKIRGYLTSPQELRAWNRFVAGTAADIELSDREMDSVLGLASKFQAELNRQAQRCKRTHFYWFDKKTAVNDAIGGPWALVLGSVTIQLKTSCACRTLTWEACIFDKYDFDPKWWNTHRSRTAEAQVILTRAAQVVGQCGWKEFYHKGCQYGFKAN